MVAGRVRDTDASYYPGFLAYSTLETATMAWPDRKPMQYQNLKTKNFIISVWSQKSKSVPGNRNTNLEESERENNRERGGAYRL